MDQNKLKMVAIVKYKVAAKKQRPVTLVLILQSRTTINMGINTIWCIFNSLGSSEAEMKTKICGKWHSFGYLDGSQLKIQDGCQNNNK